MILARVLLRACGEIDSVSMVPTTLVEPTAGGISMMIFGMLRNFQHDLNGSKDLCYIDG